jgi:hypothetical protein
VFSFAPDLFITGAEFLSTLTWCLDVAKGEYGRLGRPKNVFLYQESKSDPSVSSLNIIYYAPCIIPVGLSNKFYQEFKKNSQSLQVKYRVKRLLE